MQRTAVVVNSGLGDLSIGLEMAGFKVIAAYETDQRAAAVHRANLNAPIHTLPFEKGNIRSVPDADLLAGRLYLPPPGHARFAAQKDSKVSIEDFLELLDSCRPKAFFLVFSVSFIKNEQLHNFLQETVRKGYRCSYQALNIAKITGAPVTERMAYVVGTVPDIGAEIKILEDDVLTPLLPEEFLQVEEQIDPWYFNSITKQENISICQDRKLFYCWKSHFYEGTNLLRWNYRKIPLIYTEGNFRKITHREIARLKGFPDSYILPEDTNRSWLYQKLMFAANVLVVKQIANGILQEITKSSLRRLYVSPAIQFENLFARYLTQLEDKEDVKIASSTGNLGYDFELQTKKQTLYFDLKYYNERHVPISRIKMRLKQRLPFLENGKLVLVFTNEVPEQIRSEYWEKFQVVVWDVQNLLWVFREFEEIKNEFIALLDYSVSDIEPSPPNPDIFQETMSETQELSPEPDFELNPETASETVPKTDVEVVENDFEAEEKTSGWEDRLRQITPGREQFQEYEQFCIDILKYTLGNYLTLWEQQEQTDDGLHRFDLCCKIKSGVQHDFFDSIKHYFNTKYIVFEFKNYTDQISQKEIYTTEKYLFETALRKVAIILSRNGIEDNALRAAKGSLRESGKLILCLSDRDLLKMANIKTNGEKEPADFLSEMLDELLIHLEK